MATAALLAAGGAMAPAVAASAAPTTQAPVTVGTHPTSRQRSHGAAVTELQRRLTALHYDVAGVDGDVGPATFHAVVNGLARDAKKPPALAGGFSLVQRWRWLATG